MQETQRRDTLTGNLVRTIADRISAGQYQVGEKLPSEQEMIVEFGVSRTVVREAIANLKASGRVTTVQGRGAFVVQQEKQGAFKIEDSNLSAAQEMLTVLELRVALETESVALAALRRTPEQLATMKRSIDFMREALEAGDFTSEVGEQVAQADIAFHRAIAEATGNSQFLRLFNYLSEYMLSRSRMQTLKFGGGSVKEYLQRTVGDHERIYQAIAQQEIDVARAAVRLHLAGSRDRLLQRIGAYGNKGGLS